MILARVFNRPFTRCLKKGGRLFSSDAGTTKTDQILIEDHNDRGVLTINRPEAMNAINLDMIRKILKTLLNWQNTKSLIIIQGAGDKAFSAGGDLKLLHETPIDKRHEIFRTHYSACRLINTLKIPYVAILDGITIGAGFGLSVQGRYRIATERTVFAMPEVVVGLIPDIGGTYVLPRMRNKIGVHLALTGSKLKGKDVLKAGIATHYCKSSVLEELKSVLLRTRNINELDRILMQYCSSDDLGPLSFANRVDQINQCFSARTMEEILQKLEKDGSEFAISTIEFLRKMPPTSLKVTLRALNLGARQTLVECLQTEFLLMQRLSAEHDFEQGVRSLLYTKDKSPKFDPPRIEDVTEERVLSFFKPFGGHKDLDVDRQLAAFAADLDCLRTRASAINC